MKMRTAWWVITPILGGIPMGLPGPIPIGVEFLRNLPPGMR